MKLRRKAVEAIVACLALLCIQGSAVAADNSYYGACKESDLVGKTLKLTTFNETPPRQEAAVYNRYRYQYLSFYQNSYYSFLLTEKEIKSSDKLQSMMQWPQQQQKVLRYTMDEQGELSLYINKKNTYRYRCVFIRAAHEGYKKGDVLLTGYTANAKSTLYKLYRHL